ncbi:MAG: o-succinylbenzoate--CoA ligase [Firmicutes bacterium]|nr:o-succinylbenzoate--CoA ligase [Bacillota bacterium]
MTAANVVPEWLSRRAQHSPQTPALLFGGSTWTFAELDAAAWNVAGKLAALGARDGARIALLASAGPDYVALVHGVPRAGCILVPLNTRLAPDEIAWQLKDAGASLLVYDAGSAEKARAALAQVPGVTPVSLAGPEPGAVAWTGVSPEPLAGRDTIALDSVHSIIYTSGTTGRPKGAMITFGNHFWSAAGTWMHLGARPDDRWLAAMPLFHVGGMAILIRSAIAGVPVILHPRFDPAAANRAIDEDGATIVSVVATMLDRMIAERGDEPYPGTLRAVLLGGGPAPPALVARAEALGVPILPTYGLTETASQVACMAPGEALGKPGAAGKPLFPARIRIVRDGRPAAPGEIGEIAVAGPNVTPGYWNRPEATAAALRDGWLHTGDLGYLDAEGYLYVADRREDLIISGGENIYPAEVEAALAAHPAVAEAAVVGAPDDHWGQVPVAYIATRPGCAVSDEELLAFLRRRLAGYKIPRRIVRREELPKGPSGKILRRSLREGLADEPAAQPAEGPSSEGRAAGEREQV